MRGRRKHMAKGDPIGPIDLGLNGAVTVMDRHADLQAACDRARDPHGQAAQAQLHAVGPDGQRHVDAVVHRDRHAQGPACGDDRPRKVEHSAC